MLRLIVVLALFSASAFAQTLTKPPTLVKQVEPALPDAGVTTPGTVVMEVDLGLDGKVLDARVTSGLAPDLDAAALTAIKQFEFTPAEIDGKPAAVRLQYALTFEPPRLPLIEFDAGVPTINFQGVVRTAGTREPVPAASIVIGERSTYSR
ncbi:MAG TPA: TonB family protein, partial [Archangium sp.]